MNDVEMMNEGIDVVDSIDWIVDSGSDGSMKLSDDSSVKLSLSDAIKVRTIFDRASDSMKIKFAGLLGANQSTFNQIIKLANDLTK